MATTEILARGFEFHLNTGTIGSPVWTQITNANTWSHSPEANDADTTSFDDEGRMSHFKASRGDEFTVSCLAQEDPDNGDKDAGQAACEAWAREIGPASVKQFRITSPASNTLTFLATATVTVGGGGNDDPSTWELSLKVTGAITDSAVDSVPGTPGTPAMVAGNDAFLASWTASTGSPTGYEVTVFLDADDSLVRTLTTSDNGVGVNGLTTGTAYYIKVRAFNAAGYSALVQSADVTTT
jgi:hypothetical protein